MFLLRRVILKSEVAINRQFHFTEQELKWYQVLPAMLLSSISIASRWYYVLSAMLLSPISIALRWWHYDEEELFSLFPLILIQRCSTVLSKLLSYNVNTDSFTTFVCSIMIFKNINRASNEVYEYILSFSYVFDNAMISN